MFTRYTRFSEWYDAKTYDQDSRPGDREFYFRELKETEGGILELACGSGRLLKHFVEEGIEAWGIDLSRSLIGRGRKRLLLIPDSPFRLIEGDMTELDLPHQFGAVFIAAGAFYYLPTIKEKKDLLRRIKRHLRPGGRLVIDVPGNIGELKKKGEIKLGKERQPLPAGEGTFETFLRWNAKKKCIEEWLSYRLDLADWSVETGSDVDRLYWMEPKDLKKLVASSGFVIDKEYGDFKGSPFTAKSEHLILTSHRK